MMTCYHASIVSVSLANCATVNSSSEVSSKRDNYVKNKLMHVGGFVQHRAGSISLKTWQVLLLALC